MPDGRRIDLAVAVLPATSRRRLPEPLVFITGGPGQSALESYVMARGAFARINRDRDIVLVDQRGTGRSNRLGCPQAESLDPSRASPKELREMVEACFAEMPGDTRFYTTSIAVRDLDAVREALGYERLNLYGISYGSRVAQAYARRYPERVRAVILDGVVPMDLALGPGISLDAQRALELMFRRCEADADCAARFPGLSDEFERLQRQLQDAPVQLVLADPTSGELAEIAFSLDYFRSVVRMFSYSPETVALLPLLIHHAARTGDFVPLAAQALLVSRQLGESISVGMHNAVICTEDIPFISDDEPLRERQRETYLGLATVDFLSMACEVWPRGEIDDDFKEPWASDIPTLLLSGEADPVTPPANGDRVLAGLAQGTHVVGPSQGHGMYLRGCVPGVMDAFIRAPSETPDAACVQNIRPAPFFLRFTGPNP